MPDIHYWRLCDADDVAAGKGELKEAVTMLATGDVLADLQSLAAQADAGPWTNPFIALFVSTSHGEEKHKDGKDMYRAHTLIMRVAVENSGLLAAYP